MESEAVKFKRRQNFWSWIINLNVDRGTVPELEV